MPSETGTCRDRSDERTSRPGPGSLRGPWAVQSLGGLRGAAVRGDGRRRVAGDGFPCGHARSLGPSPGGLLCS